MVICENQHLIWIQQRCKSQLVPGCDLAFRPFTVVTSIYRGAVGGRAAENHSLCLTLQQQWLCLEAQPQKSIWIKMRISLSCQGWTYWFCLLVLHVFLIAWFVCLVFQNKNYDPITWSKQEANNSTPSESAFIDAICPWGTCLFLHTLSTKRTRWGLTREVCQAQNLSDKTKAKTEVSWLERIQCGESSGALTLITDSSDESLRE